ncbi:hypothetical protein [Arenicella xantha]|uniref:Uncharacterized protein n=1 Tax=Arenicella xantha TaxID=644221 RepID=A0A395JMG8_9GAMM|nr:hypothetical protein [Arenicella xantha]RBP51037.1 hypothetical protein DFR28_102456 [Arenicella xantha]
MNHFLQSKYLTLAATIIILTAYATNAEAARKGAPGSEDRTEWCDAKLRSCVDSANEDCDSTYGTDLASSLCQSSEVNTCKNAYGSTSDCLTRDRVADRPDKTPQAGGPQRVAPASSSTRKPRDHRQTSQQNSTRVNSAAISTSDCTAYGGTVQRDASCASKQSCLINNSNGCITKAAK